MLAKLYLWVRHFPVLGQEGWDVVNQVTHHTAWPAVSVVRFRTVFKWKVEGDPQSRWHGSGWIQRGEHAKHRAQQRTAWLFGAPAALCKDHEKACVLCTGRWNRARLQKSNEVNESEGSFQDLQLRTAANFEKQNCCVSSGSAEVLFQWVTVYSFACRSVMATCTWWESQCPLTIFDL